MPSGSIDGSTSSTPAEDSPVRKWYQFHRGGKTAAEDEVKALPYWKLFKYAKPVEKGMLAAGLLCAMGHGALLPILIIIFGSVVDDFRGIYLDENEPNFVPVENIADELTSTTNWFLYTAVVAFVLSFFQILFCMTAANRMGNHIRNLFFRSLLRQDCEFYDVHDGGKLTYLVTSDVGLVQAGIGDKLATAVQYISSFVVGIAVGFAYGWKLALVILAITPVLLVSGALFANASAGATGEGQGAYGDAGGIASEVLSLIKTVTAFGGQEEEVRRYEKNLNKASLAQVKASLMSGLGLGTAMLFILSSYGLGFWYGGKLNRSGEMSAGDVLLTFFAISVGANSLGTAGPAFKSFSVARGAAPRLFEVIDRESEIDPQSDAGLIPDTVKGGIVFEDVDFNYSNRIADEGATDLVLENFNLSIPAGSSEAFVGPSGCGKTTAARLIERFYKPQRGCVKLDGVDIADLNVRWLRSQIGYVGQMPTLFMLSIRDNIALGAPIDMEMDKKTGLPVLRRREVSDEDVIAAAKQANAHAFITKLPEGYNTMLGERGAMLSGGQKQRVCIARALVRNPKILLLDESTASLDATSERIVQDALEKASEGRTTLTIAHRLSTIRNADSIAVINRGSVVERGSHDELTAMENGVYRNLFELQNVKAAMHEKELHSENEQSDRYLQALADARQLSKRKSAGISASKTGAESTDAGLAASDHDEDEKQPDIDKGVVLRAFKVNSGEAVMIFFGMIGSGLAGAVWPVTAIVLAEMVQIMLEGSDADDVRLWSLMFLVIAGVAFVANTLQHGVLGISGERLTRKLRVLSFKSLLRQEMGFFDMKENSVGSLTARLSVDASNVKGLTGDLVGLACNIVVSLATGLIIAFVNCWRVSLVVMACVPGLVLGGYLEMQAAAGHDSGARKDFSGAGAVASEAVDNIDTVRSLGVEDYFSNRYGTILRGLAPGRARRTLITGLGLGVAEFCQFLIWYACFKAGGDFVAKGQCTFKELLTSVMAILFAAVTFGNVSIFAPDVGAARIAATQIFRLIDRQSYIDPESESGDVLQSCKGELSAKDVRFEYPSRPDVAVLRGLSVNIAPGKTLALVGTSGHGKSTIISLLERFYDVREGSVNVDGHDVQSLTVQSLRSHIGIVSQEPELFNRTVHDNIAYGAPHKEGTPITEDRIIQAAKVANAHDFIMDLPNGYDTMVGARGGQLSGGQRQRVAIARSLVRDPGILLLDEATSALDAVSEQVVQEALHVAASGRTTVIVAHRLSTIKKADAIAVVHRGKIAETGTHDELLSKNGQYVELVRYQISEI